MPENSFVNQNNTMSTVSMMGCSVDQATVVSIDIVGKT